MVLAIVGNTSAGPAMAKDAMPASSSAHALLKQPAGLDALNDTPALRFYDYNDGNHCTIFIPPEATSGRIRIEDHRLCYESKRNLRALKIVNLRPGTEIVLYREGNCSVSSNEVVLKVLKVPDVNYKWGAYVIKLLNLSSRPVELTDGGATVSVSVKTKESELKAFGCVKYDAK
ncbi:hypothetical protein P3W33_14075 [Luteibacter sp. PPL552]